MPCTPTVSVILPTYNRASYLAEAITSVIGQTHPPQDIIVVDDGSTDHTRDIVAGFAPRVAYVHQTNAGKLAAIDTGLNHATGELVWIMDDDDIAPPEALVHLAAPFAGRPATVMSYGCMTRFSGAGPSLTETPVAYSGDPRPFLVRLMEDCFITGHPCVLTRRSALDRLRPFDRAIVASEDYFLHLNVATQGSVAPVDAIVLRQRQHDGPRGPRASRYAEAERVANWIAYDGRILSDLLDRLPLQAYLDPPPWRDRPLSTAETRHALIQRAVIAGRKKLWPRAIADLRTALSTEPSPLPQATLALLSGMLGSRYGFDEVIDHPETLDALHRCVKGRADRGAILTELSRPILHRIKSGHRPAAMLRCWFRLMDLAATGTALRASARRNLDRLRLG